MSENEEKSAASINILPADTHGGVLVELVKGQQRLETMFEMQNRRLFGEAGIPGMLPAMIAQHTAVAAKLDNNKDELLTKIESAKTELSGKIEKHKDETDTEFKSVRADHDKLKTKVTWYSGGIALAGFLVSSALAWFGIVHTAK